MGYSWSTHQLTEFFSAITRSGDVSGAAALAVERAAEATEAEIGAIVCDGAILGCLGLGSQGRLHSAEQLRTVSLGTESVTIDALGTFHTTVTELGNDVDGLLVLGRLEDEFQPEERQMLRGMAQVLGLAMRGLRTLEAERAARREREQEAEQRLLLLRALEKREELLETLLQIQRAVCQRAPLQVVLDAVTRGASDMLDGALVALVLRDPNDPAASMVPSIAPGHEAGRHDRVLLATAADAMGRDRPVVMVPAERGAGQGTVVAAPVHVGGDVAGSLVLRLAPGTVRPEERRDFLAAFAEQASLALTDAHTVEAVREAYHDGLTGLPNRVLFLERLERAFELAHRTQTTIAVLFIDLDLFKQVNDTLGHAAGDELLRGVAGRIRSIVRDGDMVARLGGDEFAVLLEAIDTVADGVATAQRIIGSLEEPFVLAGKEAFIRASVGVVLSDDSYDSADDLIQDADVAMYRAKKSQPGTLRVYEPSMRTELLQHVELATEAKRAVAAGEMSVAYQPILRLTDGRLVAVEALLRWTHPRLGAVPPSTFIPLAESNGLIVEMGRWVLRESCRQLARWRAEGLPDMTLNVNISGLQLEDDRFLRDVFDILAESEVPASALTLEVTETVLMRDPDVVLRRMRALKNVGIRIAIDDFGSGYSSLSHLHRFPLDQIKIDKSFVDGIVTDPRGFAITRSIVELGRTLELEIVAEGIEEADQLRALTELSCTLGQGYLFARPLEAPAVMAYSQCSGTPEQRRGRRVEAA